MVFSPLEESGKISACENTVASTMLTGSTVSDPSRSSEGSSATPRPASSVSNGGGKNSVRCLRNGSPNLLRPQGPSRPGSPLRRYAGVPGDPDPAGPVQAVREGEAGEVGVPFRQPLLHEAVRLLRWSGMPRFQHSGHCQGSVHGPKIIGIDEVSIRKGHTYRIVVSDLIRERPIWFGGADRSEASMDAFNKWLGPKKSKGIKIAVMDMWKPFLKSTKKKGHAPQAAILFDKFHVIRHLGEALDKVRRSEYRRLSGKDKAFVKGQRYTLLSRWENLSLKGRQSLKKLLAANKRLQTAYLLKESFDQLWGYRREGWARRFFDNWKESLKWQRLKPYREVRRDRRAELERDRCVLRGRGEVLLGVRRGGQHQDPGHPTAGVRTPGRRIPSPEGPHLHAARDLKCSHSTHSITR